MGLAVNSKAFRPIKNRSTGRKLAMEAVAEVVRRSKPTRLVAYFDDSGHYVEAGHGDNTPALVICGFVSTLEEWQAFDQEWKAVLARPEFDLDYFHMKELRNFKGKFEKFSNNLPLQTQLIDALQRIIKARTIATFGGTVEVAAWDVNNSKYQVAETYRAPVVLAGQFAIHKMMRWLDANRPDYGTFQAFLDQGVNHFGELARRVKRSHGIILNPAVMKTTPAIQGCDLVAWELHRAIGHHPHSVETVAGNTVTKIENPRGAFQALLDRFVTIHPMTTNYSQGRTTWYIVNTDDLRAMCEFDRIPKRHPPP